MNVERLESSAYLLSTQPPYLDVHGLHGLFDSLAFRANVILVGPKGLGKSLAVASYCAAKKYPLVTFDCADDVRRSQLIGTFVLRGEETPFVLGPLTTAFEVANEVGHCVLVLEECSALSPSLQKVLNSTTDFRRRIEVAEAKRVFQLKPEAKLWVVGTMNLSSYSGTYALNEDLKSRFRMIPVDYLSEAAEKKVLSSHIAHLNTSFDTGLLTKLMTLAKETRQETFDYALSTRDLVQIIEDIAALGVEKALWIASGKYEASEQINFRKRVKSIFGVTDAKIPRS